tara:strand:+ start:489 stop:662 length:174 start_codon:yes stop_codon:yes gene_type:complete
MKVGDVVFARLYKKTGVVIELSEPTVQFPYQVANILFVDGTINEVATTTLEVTSECW